MTIACFQSAGSVPSFIVLFISRVRGLARASVPSFRGRTGISGRPDDFLDFGDFKLNCAPVSN